MEFAYCFGTISEIAKRTGINNINDEIRKRTLGVIWAGDQNAALEWNLSGQKSWRRWYEKSQRNSEKNDRETVEMGKTRNEIRWLFQDRFEWRGPAVPRLHRELIS